MYFLVPIEIVLDKKNIIILCWWLNINLLAQIIMKLCHLRLFPLFIHRYAKHIILYILIISYSYKRVFSYQICFVINLSLHTLNVMYICNTLEKKMVYSGNISCHYNTNIVTIYVATILYVVTMSWL